MSRQRPRQSTLLHVSDQPALYQPTQNKEEIMWAVATWETVALQTTACRCIHINIKNSARFKTWQNQSVHQQLVCRPQTIQTVGPESLTYDVTVNLIINEPPIIRVNTAHLILQPFNCYTNVRGYRQTETSGRVIRTKNVRLIRVQIVKIYKYIQFTINTSGQSARWSCKYTL